MADRNGLRRRLKLLPVVTLVTVALPVAAASAQAPGLPRTFQPTRIDTPVPVGGGSFGWGVWSAELTGDGKQDLLVAQGQIGTSVAPTKVFIFNGATGGLVDTIDPPENNPLEAQVQPAPPAPAIPPVYRSPELAFVYVETMPDLGSCPGGDGPDADKLCDAPVIGPGDGIPEIIVGARALRVNITDGSIPPHFDDPNDPTDAPTDPQIGRGYVIDGKTRAVLKRIDMPAADRQALVARSGRTAGTPAFARTMSSAQGMPPCAGLASENNDEGVGPCPDITRGTGDTTSGSKNVTNVNLPDAKNGQMLVALGPDVPGRRPANGTEFPAGTRIVSGAGSSTLVVSANATKTSTGVRLVATDYRYSQAVRIGDLDGGGEPDIVITARGFPETRGPSGSAPTGSECKTNTTGTGTTCSAGKQWVYRGEDIAGTSPSAILDTTMNAPTPSTCVALPTATPPCFPNGGIQNPDAQANPAGGEYGGNLFRVGDLVGDDGFPDYIIPYRGADFPLKNPDINAGLNMGSAYLFNGKTGSVARTIVSPEPQIRAQFSGNFNAGRAVGDLGATSTPDILLPAPLQNVQFADQGRAWIFNGDLTAGGGGEQSWNFGMINDPEPYVGGNFAGGLTGVGDLVDGPGAPGNEVLAGGNRFDSFTEASQDRVPDVNFMNPTLDKNLMTIPHPDGTTGDGFGVGITPMGDINGDGFLDFAVSAYLADGVTGAQGRAWIFKSDNSPLPPAPTSPAPIATGPVTPATQNKPLLAGTCSNQMIGTDKGETLKGTLAGDRIFGFAGNDTIMGNEGADCEDGGSGNDALHGGDANDQLVGGGGGDLIYGDDGRDQLFGGYRNDRLYGDYGRDMVAGGAGDDLIEGGPDNDRLFGESGRDRLVGGDGKNYIDAGSGNDSIDALNGERDRVLCGKGRDRVTADKIDRLNSCEIVRSKKPKAKKAKAGASAKASVNAKAKS